MMENKYSIVRGKKVVINGQINEATVLIKDGIVVDILPYQHNLPIQEGSYKVLVDAKDNQVIMGGLVDSHVHVNEPGRTEWEGFVTATSAAAAGGVTTIIDMPLNSDPVTTSFKNLQDKIESMNGKLFVDVGLLGGIVPNNENEIKRMILEGGVVGFKCFLVHSGIDDFPSVDRAQVDTAMKVMKELQADGKDVVIMFHAEVPGPIETAISSLPEDCDASHYNTFLHSRPKAAENEAIEMVIDLTKENQVRSHIVHLSSAEALPMIRQAHKQSVPISVETTFHYLYFVSEKIPSGNTLYKCCPPIRESTNRDQLWEAVADRTISLIISDHSPCTIDLKLLQDGDFMKAWGGISSLQLGLSIMWTEARQRGFKLEEISDLMCDAPARLVNLNDRKGSIAVGRDADFLVWDPDQTFVVDQENLYVRNRASPYHGQTLHGVVYETILRGQSIYSRSNGHIEVFTGQRLVPTNIQSSPTYPNITIPPIERLNQLNSNNFFNVVNLLFETAPPLSKDLYAARPFKSYESLIAKAKEIIEKCNEQDKIEIINAHPRIGDNPNQIKNNSSLSYKEQGCDKETQKQEDPELIKIYEELASLNKQYEDKYKFKFVVFVNGRSKAEIIPVLKKRLLESNHAEELSVGLNDMIEIAYARLSKLLI